MTATADFLVCPADAAAFRRVIVGTPHRVLPFLTCIEATAVRVLDAHVVVRVWYGEGNQCWPIFQP